MTIQRTFQRWVSKFASIAGVASALACGPVDGRDDIVELGPISRWPFAVSDFFTPSGHMGDGAEPDHITMHVGEDCLTRPLNARGKCYNFAYAPGDILWAGVYWQFPSNNWGSQPGRLFKPWRFENGVLMQRYGKIKFSAAAVRDTLEIGLVGTDSNQATYTLRNATFTVEGPSPHTVVGNAYAWTENTDPMTGQPLPQARSNAKAVLIAKPGNYTVTLADGWELWTGFGSAAGAVPAIPVSSSISFTLTRETTFSGSFDFQVGADTVRVPIGVPPVRATFFAGDINDKTLQTIVCKDPTAPCLSLDQLTTPKPIEDLTREFRPITMDILMSAPCVSTATERPMIDTATGIVTCPAGTLTPDGQVANCPPGRPGLFDGTNVRCCRSGFVNGACPDPTTETLGSFVFANEIEQPVIGGYGWATNYAEFETQQAILLGQPTGGAGGPPEVDHTQLPPTNIYLDDIVWDFAQNP